jgi:hypothetical protein
MYPSHQWPPPGPVYNPQFGPPGYYPPAAPIRKGSWWPKDKSNRVALILVGALMAFVMFAGAIVVLATVDLFPPDYTPAEQHFLADVHASAFTSWPDDEELVREGHELCAWDTKKLSHGSLGWSLPPDLLQRYSEKQLLSLDMRADHRLCSPYASEDDDPYPY